MDNFIQSLKPRIKSLRESLYLIARNKLSLTALIILVLLIIGALLAPYIIPYPEDLADATHTQIKLQAPSLEHLMGTDELGRDIFSRVVPDSWWYCIFPGRAIVVTVLCFNLLGDAIREILDPKTRKN